MGAAQVVQQVPDGLPDAPRGEAQGAGFLSEPLEGEGDVDALAAGVDGLAVGTVDLSGYQLRLHGIIQGGIGGNGIDHRCAPALF